MTDAHHALDSLHDESLAWAYLTALGYTAVVKCKGQKWYYRRAREGEKFSHMAPPGAEFFVLEGNRPSEALQVTLSNTPLKTLLDSVCQPEHFWRDMVETGQFPRVEGGRYTCGEGPHQATALSPEIAYLRYRVCAHFGDQPIQVPECIIDRVRTREKAREEYNRRLAELRGHQSDPSP